MYIFLDESGNFKGDKEDYFIVGGFVTGDPKRTARMFRLPNKIFAFLQFVIPENFGAERRNLSGIHCFVTLF